MVFDEDGFLFIAVGDRGLRDKNPQSLDNSCGKIHRIYEDEKIPKDIFSGSMRFKYISRVRVDGNELLEEEKILEDIGRVRCIEMGQDGFLYVGVENPGRILKVKITE